MVCANGLVDLIDHRDLIDHVDNVNYRIDHGDWVHLKRPCRLNRPCRPCKRIDHVGHLHMNIKIKEYN